MNYNPNIHNRNSIRLKHFDYSNDGKYFITICTKNRECNLGKIINAHIKLSKIGEIVQKYWNEIPQHFKNIKLDQFIIMPNHLHGIIINHFKSAVKHFCNKNNFNHFQWQRNYYEHIIRNEFKLNRIREYIINNPLKWNYDRNNPNVQAHLGMPQL